MDARTLLEQLHAAAAAQPLPIPAAEDEELRWLRNHLITYDSFVDGLVSSYLMQIDIHSGQHSNQDRLALIDAQLSQLSAQEQEESRRELIQAYCAYKQVRDEMLALLQNSAVPDSPTSLSDWED